MTESFIGVESSLLRPGGASKGQSNIVVCCGKEGFLGPLSHRRRGRTPPTYHVLWARGCRGHTVSRRGFNDFRLLRRHSPAGFPGRAGRGCLLATLEFQDGSGARPGRRNMLLRRRKILPFHPISGCELRLIKELHAKQRKSIFCFPPRAVSVGSRPGLRQARPALRPIGRKRRQEERLLWNRAIGFSFRTAGTRTNIEQRRLCQEVPALFRGRTIDARFPLIPGAEGEPTTPASKLKTLIPFTMTESRH